MSRKKITVYLTVTAITSLAILLSLVFNFNDGQFALANYIGYAAKWVHYPRREPTEENKGIKEYWVQCGGSYQFTEPESENIVEASGYDTSGFLENDDRWIPNEVDCDADYWEGKKWVALGTSITSTRDTNGDGIITGQYPNTLETLSNMVQTNYGVEGAVLGGHTFLYSLYSTYKTTISNADLITVEGGVNDWYSNRPLGTINDTMAYYNDWTKGGINLVTGHSSGTFAGSCYSLFNNLKNINPTATIVVLTDCSGPDGGICAADRTNARGLYLSDYNQMMLDIADAVGIKSIDVGAECGITGQDSQYFTDHIHLNAAGGAVYANYIWSQLQTFTKKVHDTRPNVTVTFKTNNQTINTQTFERGGSAYAPYPGTYENRNFISWDKSLKNITADTVINSTWTENIYTISFDTDGGSTIADISGYVGASVGEVSDPNKAGYIFDGWDQEVPSVIPNHDLTLTAYWREPDNLFSRLTETKGKRLMMNGSTGAIYEYSQAGYNLSDYIALNGKRLVIEFDVDTYRGAANYSTASLNIIPSSNTNGGYGSYAIFYESVTGQESRMTITRDGNHFSIVWNGYDNYTYIRLAYESSNLHNLTVKYPTYTVTFSDGENIISEQSVVYGESAIAPEDPTKEGYIFDGWDKTFNNVKSNLVVTAKWKDEDELFDSTQVLANTFINNTANGTASGYYTSNYIACEYNHKIRIDVTRKGSGMGDFRIALGASNNNSYLGAWQVGASTTLFDENGVYDGPHLKVVREIVDNHTYFVVTVKNSSMHYVRFSYQSSVVSALSVKAVS